MRFQAGVAATLDLQPWLPADLPADHLLALLVDAEALPTGGPGCARLVPAAAQWPEFRLAGQRLLFDGGAAGALQVGASAARLRLAASRKAPGTGAGNVWVSDVTTLVVDSPLATLQHGLDQWPDLAALGRAVQGAAPAGSAPRGRTDLIGQIFLITPGMLSEPAGGHGDPAAPVGAVQFPCTLRALDPQRRPVLRSVTGQRDVLQIEATLLPPIEGEVVLQDLVIRDNRHWHDTGEAGVRLKDRFPGRSLRIERCEFVRCQNAVAGGSRGQSLYITDCRIVDCGLGARAHGVYVGPQWLHFTGNHVLLSAGNRLARAHLLKSRALVSRILGNRFELDDAPGSYLIDLPNGGDAEIGGNLLQYGRLSDNDAVTLIAYAAEGPLEQPTGADPVFAPDRRFQLVVRNNSVRSRFAGSNRLLVVFDHGGRWPDGRPASTWPAPLQLDDNLVQSAGPMVLALRRESRVWGARETTPQPLAASNVLAVGSGSAPAAQVNRAGAYVGRRFSGHTTLGTGSQAQVFTHVGAG